MKWPYFVGLILGIASVARAEPALRQDGVMVDASAERDIHTRGHLLRCLQVSAALVRPEARVERERVDAGHRRVRCVVAVRRFHRVVDAERLEAAAEALLLKRTRTVACVWPQLARAMNDDFAVRSAACARVNPLPSDGSPLADGRVFIDWLERAGFLTDEGRLEAFAFDVRYRIRNDAVIRRRGPLLRVLRLKALSRFIIVVRLPLLGERWLNYEIL